MTAALATFAFLAAAWFAVVALARTIEESGSKIAAALSGEPLFGQVPALKVAPVRFRPAYPPMRAHRARVRPVLRAAA